MQTKNPFYQILKNDINKYQNKLANYYNVLWQNKQTVFFPLGLFLAFLFSAFFLNYIFHEFQREKEIYLDHQKQELLNTKIAGENFTKIQEEKERFKKKFAMPVKNSLAYKTLDKIKRQLKFDHFDIKMSDEKVVDKKLGIYSKKMIVTTKATTDRKFYQLIDRLHHQMPGLINFSNFSIKKTLYTLGNKNYTVFEGQIECYWIKPKNY